MNWDAVAAIGETLGAIAVFVTLAYLAVQVRQSRIAQNTATAESVKQGFNAINALIAGDASLAQIILKGNDDPESLNPVERFRYYQTWQSYTNQYSQMFELYKAGALSKDVWETHLDAFVGTAVSRDAVNASEDFWQAFDAYGPPRRSKTQYHRAALKES